MFKLLMILPCLITVFQPLFAKVEPPNYNFSVDTLHDFLPGKLKADVEKKYGKPEVMEEKFGTETLKFQVAQIRYKFPVIVQVKEGVIQDFFAKMPSYFLHDIFFQSLINRLGKQTTYKKTGEEAYYTWDKKPFQHIYSAACTITCFPIFYAVYSDEQTTTPLLKLMQKASQGK